MEYTTPIGVVELPNSLSWFYGLVNYAEWLRLAMNCLEWYQLKPSLAPTSPVATQSRANETAFLLRARELKSATTTRAAHIVLGRMSSARRHIHMRRFRMGIEPL
ncbi:hypothetical protein L208DRAFT_1394190 [Tricholoma matsutake]|nr:hypothetical protein L208DRAFT_1394190 [Tricholoma matsutake 945]